MIKWQSGEAMNQMVCQSLQTSTAEPQNESGEPPFDSVGDCLEGNDGCDKLQDPAPWPDAGLGKTVHVLPMCANAHAPQTLSS